MKWPIKTLGSLGDFSAGIAFSPSLQGRVGLEFPFAKVGDISIAARTQDGELRYTRHSVSRLDLSKLRAKPVPAGSIIFAKIGEAIKLCNQVVTVGDTLIDNNVIAFTPNGVSFDIRYAIHAFRQIDMYALADKTTVPAIRKSRLEAVCISVPPIEEQRRIAAILDKADAIRRKREQAIQLADEFLRSLFLDMFGDPVRNPKGWPVRPLGELLVRIESGWSPLCSDRPAANGEWGVLKLGSVTSCEFNSKENKALLPQSVPRPKLEIRHRDVLFARKNTYELVAACALVLQPPPRLMMSDLIFRLNIKDSYILLPEFLWQALIQPSLRRQIQSLAGGSAGSMPNISKGRLLCHSIPVPPVALQTKFAGVLSRSLSAKQSCLTFDLMIAAASSSLSALAFSGKT